MYFSLWTVSTKLFRTKQRRSLMQSWILLHNFFEKWKRKVGEANLSLVTWFLLLTFFIFPSNSVYKNRGNFFLHHFVNVFCLYSTAEHFILFHTFFGNFLLCSFRYFETTDRAYRNSCAWGDISRDFTSDSLKLQMLALKMRYWTKGDWRTLNLNQKKLSCSQI